MRECSTHHLTHQRTYCAILQENILVDDHGDALVADLGLSSAIDKAMSESLTSSTAKARFTFRFAAPELVIDPEPGQTTQSKTRETDVYAFAMLILQVRIHDGRGMLTHIQMQAFTGKQPWAGKTDAGVLLSVARGEMPSHPGASATQNGLLAEDWETCKLCWSFAPKSRPDIGGVLLKLLKASNQG